MSISHFIKDTFYFKREEFVFMTRNVKRYKVTKFTFIFTVYQCIYRPYFIDFKIKKDSVMTR